VGHSQSVSAIPGLLASRVEPVPAGLSRQGAVKTTLAPAAVIHAPMDTEQEPGHFTGINLFRVSCACGYRGCWYSGESLALDAHWAHVERNAPVAARSVR
jgi:hypothetical protein